MVNTYVFVRASLVSLVFSSATNLGRMSQFFYAVGRGRQVGVYTSWPECEKQVKNIANAKFRKFKTHKEAVAFIQECTEKCSPYKSPSRTRGVNDTKSFPVAGQPHSTSQATSQAVRSLVSNSSFYSQQVTTNPSQRFERNNLTQVPTSHVPSVEMSRRLSPQTLAALESLAEDDIFLSNHSEETPQSNAGVVTSNETGVNNVNFNLFFEKLERHCTEIKTTLNQVLLRVTNLENKVQALSCQNTARNPSVESQSIPGSSVKRTLLESYNIPQPVGKRHFSTSAPAQEDEIEVVPVPPKKIPKIEVNSDDEVDGLSYDFKVNENGYVIVYTDGACEKNGRSSAKAGIGVWFGDCHPLNISEPVHGRPTNNTAEIQAVVQALEVGKRAGVKKIIVHTDSEFTINCITKWVQRWQKNNWKVASGGDVKNKEDLILLLDAMKGMDVKWEHVRGHQGIHGNEMADRLARSGALRYKP